MLEACILTGIKERLRWASPATGEASSSRLTSIGKTSGALWLSRRRASCKQWFNWRRHSTILALEIPSERSPSCVTRCDGSRNVPRSLEGSPSRHYAQRLLPGCMQLKAGRCQHRQPHLKSFPPLRHPRNL